MIKCTLSTSYRNLEPEKILDPAWRASWNALARDLLAPSWEVTDEDVEKSRTKTEELGAKGEKATQWNAGKSLPSIDRVLNYDQLKLVGAQGGIEVTFSPDEPAMIVRLEERIAALGLRMGDLERLEALSRDAAAVVHVPDMSLLYVDEVTYMDNCCTDNLGDMLSEGWRILAVCPPCSQRRPDYVLGRRKCGRPLPLAQAGPPNE